VWEHDVAFLAIAPSRSFSYLSLGVVHLNFSSGVLTQLPSKPSNGLSMTYATSAPATSGGTPGSPVRFPSC
jgi:hypothetical protein